jgi:hypothetical protein
MGQGRETMIVRHLALVLVLGAAAFAGGAVVNGPGLRWAHTRLMRSLGWSERDITSINLKQVSGNDPAVVTSDAPKAVNSATHEPFAPTPSLVIENESPVLPQPDLHTPSTRLQKAKPDKIAAQNISDPARFLSSTASLSPQSSKHRKSAPQDENLQPTNTSAVSNQTSAPKYGNSTPAILDALTDLFPVKVRVDHSPPAIPSSKLPNDAGNDWTMMVQRMKTLGVSRFTIEGDTGGRVVFACLIPIAGRQAITQRFEAVGGDPVEVAEATLRRIVLWRAAQTAKHVSPTSSE